MKKALWTVLILATFLNVIGLSVGKWLHNLGAVGTWLPIAILFAIAGAAWHRFAQSRIIDKRQLLL